MDEQVDLGERIALARSAKGLSQHELASRVRLDRTALSKIESGLRRVSALELAAVADALGRPLSWFLSPSPAVIVSRRAELIRGDEDPVELDAELTLESLVREVQLLESLGVLPQPPKPLDLGTRVETEADARIAGETARRHCSDPSSPLGDLAAVIDQFGLYTYSLPLAGSIDGLMLHLESGSAVCLMNGAAEPGRRRATVAHELGHFLFDDEYSSDVMGGSSRDRRERLIDVFAASFLLPEPALRKEWPALSGPNDPRSAAVKIASEYRVSWGLVLTRLAACGLVSPEVRRVLNPRPTKADFLARKVSPPPPDLEPPAVSPAIGEAVLAAYSSDLITEERALELLHGVVDEMPPRGLLPKHLLKDEFAVA